MTVLTSQQIVDNFTIAPLAPSSGGSSSGPAGAGLGGAISSEVWQRQAAIKKGNAKERRRSIRAAMAEVEKNETKVQRLQRQQGHVELRQAGSEKERAATRGTVAKAAASLMDAPMDTDVQDPEFRYFADRLRQAYPLAKLSEILAEGAKMEQMLLDDPAAAYEVLLSSYTRAAPSPGYVTPVHAKGLRGSLARARRDQEDAADLKDWIARYGKRLPKIMATLDLYDRSLRASPAYAAAVLAVRIGGAPAVSSEIPAWEAKQAVKAQKAQHEARLNNIHRGICLAIEQGHLPGDEDTLNEMAAIMQGGRFQHHPTDQLVSLQRAAAIARHPDHKRITPRKGAKAPARSNAGSRSISGAPSAGQQPGAASRERGTGGIRDSIARVRAAM
jgi:hypothetical protein